MPTLTTSAQPFTFAKQMRRVSVPGAEAATLQEAFLWNRAVSVLDQHYRAVHVGKPSGSTCKAEEGQSQRSRQSPEKLIPWGLWHVHVFPFLPCLPVVELSCMCQAPTARLQTSVEGSSCLHFVDP